MIAHQQAVIILLIRQVNELRGNDGFTGVLTLERQDG